MKLYTEISSNDKVKIVDFGELSSIPENTELHETSKHVSQIFTTYKHIQILNEEGKYAGLLDSAMFDTDDERYVRFNGVDLVYYKSIDLVTWDTTVLNFSFEITTDATDTHSPYEGVPDIDADGTDYCTITITQKDYKGDILSEDKTVYVECSRGKLSALSVDLVNGVGTVTLTSVSETCISVVEVRDELGGEVFGFIEIQFA